MHRPAAMRRRRAGLVAALGVLVACSRPAPPAPGVPVPETRRRVAQGELVGFAAPSGAHVWRGIPFAEPPVGALRWRAPRPAGAWTGLREAVAFGPACPQIASVGGARDGARRGEPTGREDCLTLNVFAPAFAPEAVPRGDARLPVMVWIHGGGNSIGDAVPYDGGPLATRHRVVVVTAQYRLGPLGWFRHASLRGEGTSAEDRSGNFGTLDLIEALRWVHANAAAFGGDPERVTIFGESAGGHDVYTLLLAPAARGLFQRAIVESGGLRATSPAEAEHFADAPEPGQATSSSEILAKLLGADGGDGRARLAALPAPEVAAFLRGLDPADLLRAYPVRGGTGMLDMPRVFADGDVLPAGSFEEALAAGRYNRVPLVTGTNRDEAKLFMAFDPRWVRTAFGIPLAVRDRGVYTREAAYRSDVWKASAVDEPGEALRAVPGSAVFAYRFDWDELPRVLWLDLSFLLGAAHAMEIPFVFGDFELGGLGRRLWTEANAASRLPLADAMMSYWAEMAWNGDPGRGRDGSLPRWSAWGQDGATFLVLDAPAEGGGIRMARERVTLESIAARVDRDPAFADAAARCAFLRDLAARGPAQEARVAALPACAGRPAAAAGGR